MVRHKASIAPRATVAIVHDDDGEVVDRSSKGVLLGRDARGWVWSGAQRSALVIGPTRSGKTSSIIVPNVLCAPHGAVVTSTKPDVMATTATARSRSGSCLLFDPTGRTELVEGVERIGWSPIRSARSWEDALGTSAGMVAAAQRRSMLGGPADHWSERAGALLSSLLHAAALSDAGMDEVLRWVDRHQGHDALERLEVLCGTEHPATSLLLGILATDQREQSGIWSTSSGVLSAYRSPAALNAARQQPLDADELVRGAHTLFICAPGRQQAQLAPLVVGMLSEIQDASYRRADVDAPMLFALDELANIAPLPELPQLVSEGGGQGLLTIGCLQDLSQARARWGPSAEGFLSLFSTTIVLGGVADRSTLNLLRELGGDVELARLSASESRDGRGRRSRSLSSSTTRQERLSVDTAARGRPGHALVLDAGNRLGWVELSPAYRDEPWRSLIARDRRPSIDRSR